MYSRCDLSTEIFYTNIWIWIVMVMVMVNVNLYSAIVTKSLMRCTLIVPVDIFFTQKQLLQYM